MDYIYKVSYKRENKTLEKNYTSIKKICIDFDTNKELVKNIYMKVPKTLHPIIISIDRLPLPMKKDTNIIIHFS